MSENKETLIKDSIELTEALRAYGDQSAQAKITESLKDLATKDFMRAEINEIRTKIASSTNKIITIIVTAIGISVAIFGVVLKT